MVLRIFSSLILVDAVQTLGWNIGWGNAAEWIEDEGTKRMRGASFWRFGQPS